MYSAEEALQMGWINKVVALADFDSELAGWCDELIAKSPNALRVAKTSMNLESDLLYTSILHGGVMLNLLHGTDEFKEGMRAFLEKRKPDFSKFNI